MSTESAVDHPIPTPPDIVQGMQVLILNALSADVESFSQAFIATCHCDPT